MRKLQDYMELPWSIEIETREDDGTYYVARVQELPGLVATGETDEELDAALWEALADHVRSYMEDGEEPPLPEGAEEIFEQRESVEHRFLVVPLNEDVSTSTLSTQEKEPEGGILRDRDPKLEALAG